MLIDIIDHAGAPKPAHPAATVLLLRDGAGGIEVLMIHRSSKTAFGGLWAFPGGRIEDEDIPEGTAPDPLPAARRAAARETAEEVGLVIDETALTFVSHWLPPADAPVRFSTWFFAANAPDGLVEGFSVRGAPGFALAVQWHPEWQVMKNPISRALFAAFGAAARAHARGRRV